MRANLPRNCSQDAKKRPYHFLTFCIHSALGRDVILLLCWSLSYGDSRRPGHQQRISKPLRQAAASEFVPADVILLPMSECILEPGHGHKSVVDSSLSQASVPDFTLMTVRMMMYIAVGKKARKTLQHSGMNNIRCCCSGNPL